MFIRNNDFSFEMIILPCRVKGHDDYKQKCTRIRHYKQFEGTRYICLNNLFSKPTSKTFSMDLWIYILQL